MDLTGILAISDWVDLQDRLSPTMSGSLLPKYPMAEKKPCTGHASPRLPMLAFDHQRVHGPFRVLSKPHPQRLRNSKSQGFARP
jgi:hypothetical protein